VCSVYINHYIELHPQDQRGEKIYLPEVKFKRINGRVVQRFIRHVGREADGKTVLFSSISDITIDKVKLHGPLVMCIFEGEFRY